MNCFLKFFHAIVQPGSSVRQLAFFVIDITTNFSTGFEFWPIIKGNERCLAVMKNTFEVRICAIDAIKIARKASSVVWADEILLGKV